MGTQGGIFSSVTQVVHASKQAFHIYQKLSLRERKQLIQAIREGLRGYCLEFATLACEETGMGKAEDKAIKIKLALEETPGPEDLITGTTQGENGIVLTEPFPYGVVCAIHPSTNPCETLINNTISLLSAGNVVIHCPHPRAMEVSKYITKVMNKIILDKFGICNLITTPDTCSLSYLNEIMNHPDVELILSTGGSDAARSALACGKKVISAGPANPTFVVDETADVDRAAYCIHKGASFDHNITCTSEKNVIIVESVLPAFREALERLNVYYVDSVGEMLQLSKILLTEDMEVNRQYGGKSADEILKDAGIHTDRSYDLIAVETVKIHPFVTQEILAPLITVVKASNFESALQIAVDAEQGYHHTAGIHSRDTERLRQAAKAFRTTIFVKNGCSLDGIGICGVGATSFTIANVTGEGAITAKDLVRRRRCVYVETLCSYT